MVMPALTIARIEEPSRRNANRYAWHPDCGSDFIIVPGGLYLTLVLTFVDIASDLNTVII